ncbi:altronate dehydratase family protein [Flavobacteriaceae bacterium]|jgi:altronate hydrolase|nr:altronate dehydratase family protein [Flavobacteriaceae bacterium]MDC0386199.1 altronate dehydratase family protein [Flavobacteriaceae bacterium]
METKTQTLKIHPLDNLMVALVDLQEGEKITHGKDIFQLKTAVLAKHKFALKDFNSGEEVLLYGVVVGRATKNIAKGEAIHTHNLTHDTEAYQVPVKVEKQEWSAPLIEKYTKKNFLGYHRPDGKVGTENNWLVIPLVFCQNRNIEELKNSLLEDLGYGNTAQKVFDLDSLIAKYKAGATQEELLGQELLTAKKQSIKNPLFPNVDGIYFLTHDGGCGGATSDAVALCSLLAGYINNPNVAGATVLSLGCQHAQISILERALKRIAPELQKPVFFMEQQQSTSEPEYLAACIKKTFVGLIKANQVHRAPAPLSKLTIGLECGGSDGFSGISANPVLGFVSDIIVGQGGAAVLSEFPELNGVEQELVNRCNTLEKAQKFEKLMREYNTKASALGAGFDSNPSPGNIKDGLITDAIKSAGAAKKGGTSPIVDVLDYTEQVVHPGLNLLCTPGNDVESTTALAGSGANLILFTTGLGTPTGNPAVPVVKVASNTHLYNKMKDIIDFNSGTVIEGKATIEACGEELLNYIIDVASGRKEVHARRLGQNDFIPWKRGMSL